MTDWQRLGILVYILVIVQNVATLTAFFIRVKPSLARRSLVACQISIILWLLLGIFEILYHGTKVFPYYVRFIVINLYCIGPLWLLFTLDYLELIPRRIRLVRWLLFVPAVLSAIPSFSDRLLYLTIQRIDYLQNEVEWGILLYINTGLMVVCIVTSAVLILRQSLRDRVRIRMKLVLVASLFIPIVTILLNYFKKIPDPGINMVPVTLSFFTGVITFAVLKHKIIDIRSIASYAVYRSISDAVLIIDRKCRIIDQNPAAQMLLAAPLDLATGQNLNTLLERLSQLCLDPQVRDRIRQVVQSGETGGLDVTVKLKHAQKVDLEYRCSVNPLRDDTERLIGHIISFSDVTVLRQATINDERLRLAGDLHDSIGHSLNTITMNLEYVLGQPALSPEVARMVRVSYERSQSALVDLRRIVDELKPLDLEKVGLLRSLEALFGRFHQLPVSIRFTCEAVDDALIRRLKAGEAIYYICMEAVHNAIRHGRARSIDVMLAHRAGQLLLFISDDGSGSDPVSEGNGLSNMRRRVQALGGTFEYGSIYDGGFNIMINLPASPVSERK